MTGLPPPPTPPRSDWKGWRPVVVVAAVGLLIVTGLMLIDDEGDPGDDQRVDPPTSASSHDSLATTGRTTTIPTTTAPTTPSPVPLAAGEGALVVTERQISCCYPDGSVGLLQVQGWDGRPTPPTQASTSTPPPPVDDRSWPRTTDADYRTYEPVALPAGIYTVSLWQHVCTTTCPTAEELTASRAVPGSSDLCVVDIAITEGTTLELEARWAPGRGCLRLWTPATEDPAPDAGDTEESREGRRRPTVDLDTITGPVHHFAGPGMPGGIVPEIAWIDGEGPGWFFLPRTGRREVRATPGGEVIGFDYADIGYIPRELAEHPSFDARRLTVARHGCVPSEALGCQLLAITDFDTIADAEITLVPLMLGLVSPELRAQALSQMPPDVRAWAEAQAQPFVTTTQVAVTP
jgi:hypothetical protein